MNFLKYKFIQIFNYIDNNMLYSDLIDILKEHEEFKGK